MPQLFLFPIFLFVMRKRFIFAEANKSKAIIMKRFSMFSFLLCLIVKVAIGQTVWHDPLGGDTLFIGGRGWNGEIGRSYNRFPERFRAMVRPAVWSLSQNSSGLYVDFVTNSEEIVVKYTVAEGKALSNVGYLAKSGVDLYSFDADGRTLWCSCFGAFDFGRATADTITFRYKLTYPDHRGREYRLYLPLYNKVEWMQIGTVAGSRFYFEPLSQERPIVCYGTSILQGASPSRTGLAWTNIIQRELDVPVYNLGFSGNGKMEDALFRILGETDARLFIIDCMPNMTSLPDSIVPRLTRGIRWLRTVSDAPILLAEHCGYNNSGTDKEKLDSYKRTNAELKKAYEGLVGEGVEGIGYITEEELGLSSDLDSQIDGVHANDIGMRLYADAYLKKISSLLDYHPLALYRPVRQRRDAPGYEWPIRHDRVVTRNRTTDPEILLIGNSITHYWSGEPYDPHHSGEKSWHKLFGKRRVTNMGFGWDRIENIFWRFYHGELDNCRPQHIFLMAGTNNIHQNTNEEIASGVRALVDFLRAKQPQAKVHVVKIYPRRGMEKRMEEVNRLIARQMPDDGMIDIIDVTPQLTSSDGKIIEELFSDGLHPNEKGYERIASVYKKYIEK